MSAGHAAFIRERFGLAADVVEPVGEGWDSDTYEVDGAWIFRFPRRPEVEVWMQREIGLLAELGGCLSVPVPRFELVSHDPLCVGYRKLPGDALPDRPPARLALEVGRFLSELHSFPAARAPSYPDWRDELEETLAGFRRHVLPLLDPAGREAGAALLGDLELEIEPAVVHADLGPEHLLSDGERLTGVIDWSDARVADPALDFAWVLHVPGEDFAGELVRSYGGLDEALRQRALFYHRLGPWHEVVYGLETGQAGYVESGLSGVRARLASGPLSNVRPFHGR